MSAAASARFVNPKGNKEFREVGEGAYRLTLLREGLQFDVTRLRWERGELFGLLSVASDLPGSKTVDGMLSVGTFNLTSVSARSARARELAACATAPEIDFRTLLEEFCQRTLKAEQTGQPIVLLRNMEVPSEEAGVTVFGVPIPLRNPIIAYGPGGTGKTTIALGMAGALEQLGIPTLYLDWELNEFDHRRLAERLFGPDLGGLDLKYRRCERPLVIEAEAIEQLIERCGIRYVICDSAGYASDGRPEDAEVALRFGRALRQLRVGSLTLAHIASGEHGTEKPFGSVFWHNSARATWYLERTLGAEAENTITVGLFNKKNNLGRLHAAIGLQLMFEDGQIAITPVNVAENEQLAARLPLGERMAHLLRRQPMTIAAIAEALDAKPDTVAKAAARGNRFTKAPGPDGVYRIALVERRTG
jgi:hypothetical protein